MQLTQKNAIQITLATSVIAITTYLFLIPKKSKQQQNLTPPKPETHAEENKFARNRWTKRKQAKAMPEKGHFDTIIIGGGPSGMSCAASLARIGHKCLVLEQGDELGGGSHIFTDRGYEFETGVHYIGIDPELERMLDFATYGSLKMCPIGTPHPETGSTIYDEIRIADRSYPFVAGVENLRSMLHSKFPSDQEIISINLWIERVLRCRHPVYKQSAVWYFRLKVLGWLPTSIRLFLQQKVLGSEFYKNTQQTAEDVLNQLNVDPASELGCVMLGQYSDSGVRPDKLSAALYLGVVSHYLMGSCYPEGGSGAIPRKLNRTIRHAGGASFAMATVDSLLIENNQCVGVVVQGEAIKSTHVVSSIGALPSYQFLLPHSKYNTVAQNVITHLKSTEELSVSYIFLFIALDITNQPKKERDHTSHNRWLYPGRDFTQMEKNIEQNASWSQPMPMFVASGSAKDKNWSSKPGLDENKKTIVVLSVCPWKWVEQFEHLTAKERKKNVEYQNFKKKSKEKMMEQGFRQVFPELEQYITFTEVGTPLSTKHYLNKRNGECYGRAATPKHWSDPALVPHTPLNNYYLTGQDIGTLGIAGCISSGYLTANVVAGYGSPMKAIGGLLGGNGEISQACGLPPIYG